MRPFDMRLRTIAFFSLMALALAGCNESLESVSTVDLSKVKNKVTEPLSPQMLAKMRAKGMDQNSPILLRIFKEEGALEVWKARPDNRFEKLTDYRICAWSGKLGPKVKEGDRQAPEGFYNLTPAHLNPNSKYYLAINTGFPNRYDAANRRSGTNLMIHGACSSSGCYSMTDEQVLEIYALARDAFKGGQKSIQLQAFPFRMTADNMARHRQSEHIPFWTMLKAGYDNFEVTKRPPEVNVCEKKYVFNQQASGGFNPAGACPAMSTPPALQAALAAYGKSYDLAYEKALRKYDGMVWVDPSEAERKAVVAKLRKGRELAYAPTGTSLEAGKLMKAREYEEKLKAQEARTAEAAIDRLTAATVAQAASGAPAQVASIPVPQPNPIKPVVAETAPVATAAVEETGEKKPFWKFW